MNIIKRIFKRSGVDRSIYLSVLVLVVFGIVMIGSASIGLSAKYGATYAMKSMVKQGVFVCIGAIAMIILARLFKTRYVNENLVWVFYVLMVVSLFACRLFDASKGSYSWIPLPGGFTIQPMEFMKIIIILFLAYHFGELPEQCIIPKAISKEKREKMANKKILFCFLAPFLACVFVFLVNGFFQKDLGSALIFAFICFSIFYCTNNRYYSRIKKVGLIVIAFILVLAVLGMNTIFEPYQLKRFAIWLDPTNTDNYYNGSFQLANGLVAFAKGGLFGRGFGASTQKFGYIPEAGNDFISAIIVEELGVLGFCVFVILPYCIIIFKLFSYAEKIKETKSKLILYGIASYFFAHIIVNVGGVSGLIPMTGVPLLMVSSGGSSTLASMMSIGIAQSIIAKYNREKMKEQL